MSNRSITPSDLSVNAVVCTVGAAVLLSASIASGSALERLGYAENQSYTTLCAEVDNINIPVLYSNTTAFRITATHPAYYPTSIDERGADFTDCDFTDRIIWRIGTNDGSNAEFLASGFTDPDEYFALDNPAAGTDEAVSNFPQEINNDWMNNQFIRFTAAEAGDANTELTIGAVLTLDFTQLSGTLEIKCRTWNGSDWTDHGNLIFDDGNRTKQWNIPDFTWLEGVDANNLHLKVVTAGEGGSSTVGAWGQFDHLELKKTR